MIGEGEYIILNIGNNPERDRDTKPLKA